MPSKHLTEVYKRFIAHTVFIDKPETREVGSGALVEFGGRPFVLSAAHVLKGNLQISLGLHTPQTPFTIKKLWTDDDLDVGYVELEPSEVRFLRGEKNAAFRIGALQKGSVPSKKTTWALSGFPRSGVEVTEKGVMYRVTVLTAAFLAYDDWPAPYKVSHNPSINFLIAYGPKHNGSFFNMAGEPIPPFNPFGFSGCAVWFFDPATRDSDNPKYLLAGVQRSYDEFYEVLVGTYVDLLVTKMAEHYGLEIPSVNFNGAP